MEHARKKHKLSGGLSSEDLEKLEQIHDMSPSERKVHVCIDTVYTACVPQVTLT